MVGKNRIKCTYVFSFRLFDISIFFAYTPFSRVYCIVSCTGRLNEFAKDLFKYKFDEIGGGMGTEL